MTETTPIQGLRFEFDSEERKLRAVIPPDPDRLPVTAQQMRAAVIAAGHGDLLLLGDGLAKAAAICNDSEERPAVVVAERRDGHFKVIVKKGQSAVLVVDPPMGGKPVGHADVLADLAIQKVVSGIDEAAIDQAIANAASTPVEIALTRPAIDGENTRFEPLVPQARERRPVIDERGIADYRNLGELVTVQAGDPLMRRHPATQGEAGEDIHGRRLPAHAGREKPWASGLSGVVPDSDDPNLLRAAIDGIPVIVDRGVIVEEGYEVDRVDLGIGNINFSGTVNVRGDVINGMRVVASGDVIIHGMVEAAHIVAGGDILIGHGVIGHLLHGENRQGANVPTALLQAAGTVSARFVENVRIEARSVLIDEQMVHCTVLAGDRVEVGGKSARKGQIMGGDVRARELIACHRLGSPSNPTTLISVGSDPALDEQIDEVVDKIAEQEHVIAELEKVIEFARRNPSPEHEAYRQRATNTLVQAQGTLGELKELRSQLLTRREAAAEATVQVRDRVHGGVIVHIGGKVLRVDQESIGGTFLLKEGELVYDHRK